MSLSDAGRDQWKGLYRAGAIGIIIAGILVLITLPLIPMLVPSLAPTSVAAGLSSIQSQSLLYGMTWGLYLVSDFLFLIPYPALYLALRKLNRAATLIAVVFNTLFVAIDVGVDIPLRFSLIGVSDLYASASTSSQQAYLATGALTMDLANYTALIATFLQFSAVILVSYTMLKSDAFKKGAAYVGIVCGVLAFLFIPAFSLGSMMLSGLFNILGFVFLVIWSLVVGYRLWKLKQ